MKGGKSYDNYLLFKQQRRSWKNCHRKHDWTHDESGIWKESPYDRSGSTGESSTGYSEIDWADIFLSILNGKEVDTEKSVEDILMHPEMDIHEAIKHTQYEGLDVIPSHLTLSTVEESLKADITMPQQFKLKGQLEKVKDEYDYCLIDCSPSISILNINGLVAADEVYIPLRCDGNSCIGMAITMNLIRTVQTYNPALQLMGCFLTQYDGRKNVARTVYELLKKILTDDIILPFRIGTTKYLEENTFECRNHFLQWIRVK